MWKVLVKPFRSRWKGRKDAVHTNERSDPIAPPSTSYVAPTQSPPDPTLRLAPMQPFPEDASSSALGHLLQQHDLRLGPMQPPQEPASYSVTAKPLPEHILHVAPSQPPSEPGPFVAQGGPQFFCGSSNNTFGPLSITNVQGNMIKHGIDYDELRRAIAAEIRSSIPAMVRHSNENALVLTDALGETLTIPWSFVPTYEELKRLLVNHFVGKLGEKRVAEGRYCIGRAEGSDDGLVVTARDWVRIRDEREQLVMSMLIEQKLDEELNKMCPKCGRTKLGTYVDRGWRVCRRCRTRFMLPGPSKVADKTIAQVDDPGEILQFRHVQKQAVMTGLEYHAVEAARSAASAEVSLASPSIQSLRCSRIGASHLQASARAAAEILQRRRRKMREQAQSESRFAELAD